MSKSDTSGYHSKADRLRALIRILCLEDFQSYEEKAETNDYVGDGVRYYLAALEKIEPYSACRSMSLTRITNHSRVLAMIKVLVIVSQRHRLCVTSKGFFGLVPMEALEGDRIFIVAMVESTLLTD